MAGLTLTTIFEELKDVNKKVWEEVIFYFPSQIQSYLINDGQSASLSSYLGPETNLLYLPCKIS
jgi:hypothetical protein